MWRRFQAWLRRRPVIHSAALTVVLSLLTGAAVTFYMIPIGELAIDESLCVESQGRSDFGSVSWYLEGYDCPLEWWSLLSAIIAFSIILSPLYVALMVVYIAHQYSVARQQAEQARTGVRSSGKSEAGILRTWEAFRAWLRKRPIIHSAALTAILTLLTGAAVTAIMVLEGAVGFEPHLCDKSGVDPEFGSVSWYMEGYDCPLQWWSIVNAFIPLSIVFSLPYVAGMIAYIALHITDRLAAARQARQEAEQARTDPR